MLRIQANINNTSNVSEEIVCYDSYIEGDNVIVEVKENTLRSGDVITLYGNRCGKEYYDKKTITMIDEKHFSFEKYSDIMSGYEYIGTEEIQYSVDEDGHPLVKTFLLLKSDNDESINRISNGETLYNYYGLTNTEVIERLDNGESLIDILGYDYKNYFYIEGEDTFDSLKEEGMTDKDIVNAYYDMKLFFTPKKCAGNYVYLNGFAYQSYGISDNGRYLFNEDTLLNKIGKLYYDISGVIESVDVIVPLDLENNDDNSIVYIDITDLSDGKINILKEIGISFNTTYKDERFYECDDNNIVNFNNNTTSIMVETSFINVTLPISTDYSLDTYKEYSISEYVDYKIENNINPIIDYEKVCFEPVYSGSDVTEIIFNLNFRERDVNNGWKLIDGGYWNNYSTNDSEDGTSVSSDLLGDIGFTDDDIFYQKSKLKKSFIRLSFVDSKYRSKQNLYYYSTIFFDTSKAFKKYINIVNRENDVKNASKYEPKNVDDRLSCTFSVKSRSNMESSSEGFYLYMFPSLVDGNKEREIYMKVEFNHAKYGKTVQMIMPTNEDGDTLRPCDDGFPLSFADDYSKALDCAYIKVRIKHDIENGRYVWEIPNAKADGSKVILNLFEIRMSD